MSTIRVIEIHQKYRDELKKVIGNNKSTDNVITNRMGEFIKEEDNKPWSIISGNDLQKNYRFSHDLGYPGNPWKVYSKRHHSVDSEKLLDQVDKDLGINTKEKVDRSDKVTRTTHNRTEMLALEITEENYSVAAGFLPQGFTTIPVKDVIGYFVIVNDRQVLINLDTGMVDSVGMGNYVVHPDIFHDVYIAVEFSYGDFIKCRKDTTR